MYADREEAVRRRSVKGRLNGNSISTTGLRLITGKRHRGDDKWEHDLFEEDAPRGSMGTDGCKVDGRDLRLKLQRKSLQPSSQSGRTFTSGVRDLREKLSGTTTNQTSYAEPPKSKVVIAKQSNIKIGIEALTTVIKKVKQIPKSKETHRAGTAVDGFLQSLGLEKYHITFQAEEVDMTALIHMTDDDLKVMGIPMGPRKKILLALESRKA